MKRYICDYFNDIKDFNECPFISEVVENIPKFFGLFCCTCRILVNRYIPSRVCIKHKEQAQILLFEKILLHYLLRQVHSLSRKMLK